MSDKIRAALDEYANAETGGFVNPQNEIGDMAWQDVEDNCERFSRESEAPKAFAALRAVLDVCAKAGMHKQTSTTRIEQVIADALGVGE